MYISNRYVIECNIQIVIRMLYHSFETLLLLSFFYLMAKSGKSFVKIGSRFQIALFFLFYRNFHPTPLLIRTPPFVRDPRVPRMQEIRSSNPPVVIGIYDPNKSRARHHRSLMILFLSPIAQLIFLWSFSY